jgi:hypothetical protein
LGLKILTGNRTRRLFLRARSTVKGLEASGLLFDRGLKIAPRGRPLLIEYLQTANPKQRARITNRTGWHESGEGSAFVLPDRSFGRSGESGFLRVIHRTATPIASVARWPNGRRA